MEDRAHQLGSSEVLKTQRLPTIRSQSYDQVRTVPGNYSQSGASLALDEFPSIADESLESPTAENMRSDLQSALLDTLADVGDSAGGEAPLSPDLFELPAVLRAPDPSLFDDYPVEIQRRVISPTDTDETRVGYAPSEREAVGLADDAKHDEDRDELEESSERAVTTPFAEPFSEPLGYTPPAPPGRDPLEALVLDSLELSLPEMEQPSPTALRSDLFDPCGLESPTAPIATSLREKLRKRAEGKRPSIDIVKPVRSETMVECLEQLELGLEEQVVPLTTRSADWLATLPAEARAVLLESLTPAKPWPRYRRLDGAVATPRKWIPSLDES